MTCKNYSPDLMAMGDCVHCGHTAQAHVPQKLVKDHVSELAVRDVLRLSMCKGMLTQAMDVTIEMLAKPAEELTPEDRDDVRLALTTLSAAALLTGETAGVLVDSMPLKQASVLQMQAHLRAEMVSTVTREVVKNGSF